MQSKEKVVFVTDQFGPKKLWDKEGLIGEFKDSLSNVVQSDDGIKRRVGQSLWYMVLSDSAKIERAKSYPGFGVAFKVTTDEPVWNTLGNLKTTDDPNSAQANIGQIKANLAKELDEEKKQIQTDSRRYGELFAQVCKAGGGFINGANPALVEEFKQLQIKLGIVEKKEENVEA